MKSLISSLAPSLALAAAGFACQQSPAGVEAVAAAPRPATGAPQELRVRLVGLEDRRGSVRVALFDGAEAFASDRQFAGTFTTVTASEIDLVFSVPRGTWGISGFHDVNGNGELDTNLVGMPTEPFAFSNDARGSFGPPSFDQIAFPVAAEPVALEMDFR
jgi:uncharacterized protein (DUF2141 family)